MTLPSEHVKSTINVPTRTVDNTINGSNSQENSDPPSREDSVNTNENESNLNTKNLKTKNKHKNAKQNLKDTNENMDQISKFNPSEQDEIVGEPIDFSFCDIQDIIDIIKLKPNSGRRKGIPKEPKKSDANKAGHVSTVTIKAPGDALGSQKSNEFGSDGHGHARHKNILTVAVRLCYNEIIGINGITQILNDHILLAPHRLCWIDFSHNKISEISNDLLTIKTLSILYFHCNNVSSKKQISKLKQLPNLKKLTMFGNPTEQKDGYRAWMIATFPNLKSLDFIRITPDDTIIANNDINLAKNKIKKSK